MLATSAALGVTVLRPKTSKPLVPFPKISNFAIFNCLESCPPKSPNKVPPLANVSLIPSTNDSPFAAYPINNAPKAATAFIEFGIEFKASTNVRTAVKPALKVGNTILLNDNFNSVAEAFVCSNCLA